MDRAKLKKLFPLSWKDTVLTVLVLMCTIAVGIVLAVLSDDTEPVPTMFVLGVLIISRRTDGYFYGLIASVVGVACVNLIFTTPYLSFNLTAKGYPLIVTTLFSVSVITSTLTARVKIQNREHLEAEKERTRANLLRAVSHDIRTPLTSILGAANAVLDNGEVLSEDEKRSLVTGVRDDANWLIRVVENLLSITRISDKGAEIIKTEEIAEEVIEESVRKFHKLNPEVSISVSVPDEIVLVPMDAILIEQVFKNLFENAVQHGGGVTKIKVSVRYSEREVIFFAEDNGNGIKEERLPTLFEGSLKRIDTPFTADGTRNFGIGLSVCDTIVKAHGGKMTAANSEDGGAVFSFSLPRKAD